jgi:serine/threonine-protein kinase
MTTDEWVGQIIGGKYRVKGLLGKGGMGLVLHGEHLRLDEEVAIKLLLPAMREVAGMTTRFLREAQAASKIKSRHVARVTDVDVMADGTPYMIMEYLDGMSLAWLRKQRGALEIHDAVRYVLEACDAIAEAHALGIVHRDLKPANLFLAQGRDGEEIVKVLDFGISKIDAPGEQDTTKTGQMMGSPKYMAPEQMLSMHDVDGRSDIWSLGAILYDFVAGRTPFVAETTPQLCSLVLHGTPPPPSKFRADLPPALEALILRCLEREPDKRFASIAELVAALAPFAPAGARIPVPRAPSSTRHTGSWSGLLPTPPTPTPTPAKDGDGDRPTEAVAAALRMPASPSGAPPSVRGGTVSVWNSAVRERAPSRRKPRAVAVAAVALALLGGAALGLRRAHEESSFKASAQNAAAVTMGDPQRVPQSPPIVEPSARAETPPTPPAGANAPRAVATIGETSQTASPEPPASPSSAPSAGSSIPLAGTAPPAAAGVRGPLHVTKKGSEPGTSPADPFAGKRR